MNNLLECEYEDLTTPVCGEQATTKLVKLDEDGEVYSTEICSVHVLLADEEYEAIELSEVEVYA